MVLVRDYHSEVQIQAGKAFTHLIKTERRPGHELVTTGVYRVLRHPGYFGWFVWACGTQILLCNVICTVLFYLVVRTPDTPQWVSKDVG